MVLILPLYPQVKKCLSLPCDGPLSKFMLLSNGFDAFKYTCEIQTHSGPWAVGLLSMCLYFTSYKSQDSKLFTVQLPFSEWHVCLCFPGKMLLERVLMPSFFHKSIHILMTNLSVSIGHKRLVKLLIQAHQGKVLENSCVLG